MRLSSLRLLCCPFCGGSLDVTAASQSADVVEYGVLTCYCSRYPLIAGIPILQRDSLGRTRQSIPTLVTLIESDRQREALLSALFSFLPATALVPPWMHRLPSMRGIGRVKTLTHQWMLRRWCEEEGPLLFDPVQRITALDLFKFYFCNTSLQAVSAYNYFAFRFGQPRHLVALSFASLLRRPGQCILDLACGFGHITYSLTQHAKQSLIIGLDHNFYALYVAKYWLAPEAEYVCCESDIALPFSDYAFSAVFCSDAFHDFVHKVTCINELKRLVQRDGVIMLVSLRNALMNKEYSPLLLPPRGYQALVSDMPHRLTDDQEVLDRYLQKQGPLLARAASVESLTGKSWLSVVASHNTEIFQDYGSFAEWPHAEGRLGLNPLYVEEDMAAPQQARLHRRFPALAYEEENHECKRYLPETIGVSVKALKDIATGVLTPEIQQLIEQYVVLAMPERYQERRWSVLP
jgi:ubiquinone/menaquinone biosynthesis C-methylase UbiE/uncharacterized protein YbaR (Trm112 family)